MIPTTFTAREAFELLRPYLEDPRHWRVHYADALDRYDGAEFAVVLAVLPDGSLEARHAVAVDDCVEKLDALWRLVNFCGRRHF